MLDFSPSLCEKTMYLNNTGGNSLTCRVETGSNDSKSSPKKVKEGFSQISLNRNLKSQNKDLETVVDFSLDNRLNTAETKAIVVQHNQ